MWTAWLHTFDEEAGLALADPVDAMVLARTEHLLGLALPRDLRSLLAETDGLADASGVEPVWSAERIAEENAGLRSGGATPAVPRGGGGLLFFGDSGARDLFAYRLGPDGAVEQPDIYLWEYAVSSARWIASDLQALLDAWFSHVL